MGEVVFSLGLHHRQHGTAQRLGSTDLGVMRHFAQHPGGDGHSGLGVHRPVGDQQRPSPGVEERLGEARQTLDGCGGKINSTAAQFEYDRHGLDGYLGNVGLDMPRLETVIARI